MAMNCWRIKITTVLRYPMTFPPCTFIQLIYSCFSRNLVSTYSIAPCSVYKPYTPHNSSIRSDEGLTLETSAFQSLYGGQFTLSTPLINQIFIVREKLKCFESSQENFIRSVNTLYMEGIAKKQKNIMLCGPR